MKLKKFTKFCITFSAVSIAVGVIITIVSYTAFGISEIPVVKRFFGKGKQVMIDKDNYVNINEDNTVSANELHKEFDAKNISELCIDIKYGDLNICTTSGDKIIVEAEKPATEYKCYEENGKLNIKLGKNDVKIVNKENEISIYIPNDICFEKTILEMGAGEGEIDTLSTDKLEMSVGAGDIYAKRLNLKKSEITVGAGDIDIEEINASKAYIEIGAGDLAINAAYLDDTEIECGMGNAQIAVIGKETDYNYEIETGVGSVVIGSRKYSGMGCSEEINNNANKNIDIDCGFGNVNMKFIDEL